jgi:hypothetical protein
MNKKRWIFLFFAVMLLSLSFALAAFSYKGTNIESSYSAGEKIRGTLNISFTNVRANALMTSNFNGSIKLLDLLEKNGFVKGTDYTCSYRNCIDSYKDIGSANTINLESGEPKIVGFELTEDEIDRVDSIKFDVSSNAPQSCTRQLIIDVLDKNESFVQNNKNSGVVCDEEFNGCFNYGLGSYTKAVITSNPYCENITLEPAPAYNVGARIDKGTKKTNLIMELFDMDGNDLGECKLPEQTQQTEKLSCIINYSIAQESDFLVCIKAASDDANYKISREKENPTCGTATNGPPYDVDFDIFANPMAFAPVGTINFNESLFYEMNPSSDDLITYVNQFVSDNYDYNCSNGCFIPFKIEGSSQELTFSNPEVEYFTKSGERLSETGFYELEKEESKLTTLKAINLNLDDADFKIPIDSKANKLYLYLDGAAILPKPLNISIATSFGFDISPKTILIGPETEFQILTSAKIIQSSWNFGDGSTGTSSGKNIAHRYKSVGEDGYVLEVEVVRNDGVRAKNSFDLSIGSLSESANQLVSEYEANVRNITEDLKSLSPFVKKAIENQVNASKMGSSIADIKKELGTSTSDEQYKNVIDKLIEVNPPSEIAVKEEGKAIPLIVGFENINTDYIESISNKVIESQTDKDNLKLAIINWFEKNYAGSMDYEIYASQFDEEKKPISTRIKIDLSKKAGADESANTAYLIIDYPKESIMFAGNYSEKTAGSGTYIPISGDKSIEFVIDGEVKATDIGMYLAPSIEKIEGFNIAGEVKKIGFQWGKFFLWMAILLVIALAIYIFLQEWYKRKYESHLFKNPNDLYNVITFIYNSRKNGLHDSEISKKLKTAGWSNEQITYAFRKLDGKRTGMWEIPIFKFFEQRKVKREIEKRRLQKIQQTAPSTQPQAKPLLK